MRAYLLAPCLGLLACGSEPSLRPLAEAPIELQSAMVIEFSHEFRPVVEVELNGESLVPFLVDSGAESTLIDLTRAEQLGLGLGHYPQTGSITGSGDQQVAVDRYAHVEQLRLGDLKVRDFSIVTIDDDTLQDYGFAGVLGQDLLARLVVIIDMQRARLHLLPEGTDSETIEGFLGESGFGIGTWRVEPVEFNPRPFFPMRIEGLENGSVQMLLDTGADSCSFPGPAIEALGLETIGTSVFDGVGGKYEKSLHRIEDFDLGGFLVGFDLSRTPQPYGVLGMNVLREFIFILDGRAGNVWLHHPSLPGSDR